MSHRAMLCSALPATFRSRVGGLEICLGNAFETTGPPLFLRKLGQRHPAKLVCGRSSDWRDGEQRMEPVTHPSPSVVMSGQHQGA